MIRKIISNSLKKEWVRVLLLCVVSCGIVLISLLPSKILEYIINDYLLNENYLNKTIITLAVLYLSSLIMIGLLDFFKQLLLIHLGQSVTKDIRVTMGKKLSHLHSLYFSYHNTGITTSRFTNDVEAINSLFTEGIISLIIDLFKVIGILIEMFLYSYILGLITIAIIPFIFLFSTLFKKRMFSAQLRNREMVGRINNHLTETFLNDEMIKVYGQEKFMIEQNDHMLIENEKTINHVAFYDSIYSPCIQMFTALFISIVLLISYQNQSFLGLSLGALAGSISYITNLFSPVENLGMELQTIQKALSGVKRVDEFLSSKEEKSKLPIAIKDIFPSEEVSLNINHVSFAYEDKMILKDMSFAICTNQKIAFVGRTGVGKTTLFRLIQGLLNPQQGNIELNSYPVDEIPNELKYQIFGYINQNFHPVKGTILDNITLKNHQITLEQVYEALKIVSLDRKVKELPLQENTIYENSLFSQGEKQLLSIARGIVCNPKILLEDEMTASLDSILEQKMVKTMEKVSINRTVIMITHRLSSCLDADKIVLLENGEIKKIFTQEEFIKDEKVKSLLLLEKSWKRKTN